LIIACLALAVATGGSAYAATKINGKNIAKDSIAGNRLKNNTLTGVQIRESRLARVPDARSASTVNGDKVMPFNITVAQDAATKTIKLPGATLYANGPSGNANLDVGATTSGETLTVEGVDTSGVDAFATQDALGTTSHSDLSPDSGVAGGGTAVVARLPNKVTTITFSYGSTGGDSCTYAGSGIATP
jgi:hypothetical protein